MGSGDVALSPAPSSSPTVPTSSTERVSPTAQVIRGDDRLLVRPPSAWWFGTVPMMFLALFFVWPLLNVLVRGFSADGRSALTSMTTWHVVAFTLEQAVLSTTLTVVIGLPASYALYRLHFRGRRWLLALITVPFVLPTVVVGAAFRGVLPPSWLGTLGAIVLAHIFFNLAVVVRLVGSHWAQVDERYAQAARTLGAAPYDVWRTITWPLLRSAVLAATSLVFLFTFTSFGVVLILGGPTSSTLEVEIYRRAVSLFDLPGAAALCLLQIVAVLVVLVASGRTQRIRGVRHRIRRSATVVPRSGAERILVGATVILGVLVALPLLALLVSSLRVGDRWGLDWWCALSVSGPTSRDVSAWESISTSLTYAVPAVVVSVGIGGLAACAVAYTRRGHELLDSALMLPLGTSAVTLGLGLLITSARGPVDLRGSWLIVPIGQALVAMPLVLRTVLPVLRALDSRLRDAAALLGAPPWVAWRTVDLPILSRALGVSAGLAVSVSLGEFGATSFLARAGSPTMPIHIAHLLERPGESNVGQAAALSIILLVLTASAAAVAERLSWNRQATT